jgi:hypothetical protein
VEEASLLTTEIHLDCLSHEPLPLASIDVSLNRQIDLRTPVNAQTRYTTAPPLGPDQFGADCVNAHISRRHDSLSGVVTAKERVRFPVPGRLVDVVGLSLAPFVCWSGQPTVVLESGS